MDTRRTVDGFVLVSGDRVESVVDAGWQPAAGWEVVDVGGRSVVPAFVDPHIHLEHTASALFGTVDCHTPPNDSITELIATLRDNVDLRDARGGWLVGQGGLFADRRFAERRMPTRADLDQVSTEVPVAVRFGFHVTILNSRALELAFEAGLDDKAGGHIVRDASGEPTGGIHELYHQLPIAPLTDDQLRAAVRHTAEQQLTRHGVATIGEISNTAAELRALDGACAAGEIPQAVQLYLWTPGTRDRKVVLDVDDWSDLRMDRPTSVGVAGVKIFVDGGYSAAGAAVLKPYREDLFGPDQLGRLFYSDDELVELVREADAAGLQVVAHVNGERAQRQVCAAARTARGTGAGNPPVRLEHAGNVVTDFATLDAWEAAGAVPVAQAAFIWTMGDFIPDYLGEYSRSAMFPFRSMLEHGRRCASSSDGAASEMAQFNPMFGVATAMRRLACTGNLVNPEERISLWDAVAMHTVDAAAAMGLSDRGTLAGGQRADIAVLSADITESDPDALAQVEADGLMIGGKFVSDPVPGGRS